MNISRNKWNICFMKQLMEDANLVVSPGQLLEIPGISFKVISGHAGENVGQMLSKYGFL